MLERLFVHSAWSGGLFTLPVLLLLLLQDSIMEMRMVDKHVDLVAVRSQDRGSREL